MCKIASMYNTDFSCTYHQQSNEKEDSDDNERYQTDMLRAFCLEEYDDDVVKSVTQHLYEQVMQQPNKEHVSIWKRCAKAGAALFLSEDVEIGFRVLFSYDFLHITHDCFCSMFSDNSEMDTEKHLLRLQKAVENYQNE